MIRGQGGHGEGGEGGVPTIIRSLPGEIFMSAKAVRRAGPIYGAVIMSLLHMITAYGSI